MGRNTFAVVFVWAAWDPVCQTLDAKLHSVQSDYSNLRFCAMDLDYDQNWPLAAKWAILDTRALVCLVSGSLHEITVSQDLNAPTKAKLSAWNRLAEERKETI